MLQSIDALRDKPREQRVRYAYIISVAITALIALLWLVTLMMQGGYSIKKGDEAAVSPKQSEIAGENGRFESQYGAQAAEGVSTSPIERILNDLNELPSSGYSGADTGSTNYTPPEQSEERSLQNLYEEYQQKTGRTSGETAPDGTPLPPLSTPETF